MGTSSTEEEGNNTPTSPQMEISSNGSHLHHTNDDDHQYHHEHHHDNQSENENGNENEAHHIHPIVDRFQRLNFDDNDEENDRDVKFHDYPLRPYAMDCSFYLKTGSCKFGQSCRFNHPLERPIQADGDKEKTGFDSNGSAPGLAKIDCKYFSTPGGCKYGDSCRYNHSTEKMDVQGVDLNFVGLPIRPWEKECDFYMRNGTCKYGANCRYHHPDPTSAKEFDRNSLANGGPLRGDSGMNRTYQPPHSSGAFQGSLSQKTNGVNMRSSVPYAAANMSSYHQGVLPNPGWIQNQVPVPLPANMGPLPHQMMNNFSKASDPLTQYETAIPSDEFPVRPGQPNCDYFMKTGDCKYRSACRYNHPTSRTPKMQPPSLSTKGSYPRPAAALPVQSTELPSLKPNYTRKNGVPYNQQIQNGEFPERPGQPECEYFMKTGNCKFRSACRYHHPKNRLSTTSPIALSDKGLPLRPGSRICRNYEELGTCKYGKNCLFHHPDDIYSVGSAAPVAGTQDNASTDAQAAATDSEFPRSGNDAQDWDDGWAM